MTWPLRRLVERKFWPPRIMHITALVIDRRAAQDLLELVETWTAWKTCPPS
jgi:hypothetical protein